MAFIIFSDWLVMFLIALWKELDIRTAGMNHFYTFYALPIKRPGEFDPEFTRRIHANRSITRSAGTVYVGNVWHTGDMDMPIMANGYVYQLCPWCCGLHWSALKTARCCNARRWSIPGRFPRLAEQIDVGTLLA